jgi:AP-2 complex subunit mu-1
MCLSALFLINSKGEIVLFRLYRDDVTLSAANAFRLQVIAAKEAGSAAPVRSIEGNSFLYIRHKDMFFVAVTRSNANACEYATSQAPRQGPERGLGRGLTLAHG